MTRDRSINVHGDIITATWDGNVWADADGRHRGSSAEAVLALLLGEYLDASGEFEADSPDLYDVAHWSAE